MADPVSLACAVAQFAGLALQTAEAIMFIRRKFIEIKGAPKLIKSLNRELRNLETLFLEVASVEQKIPRDSQAGFVELVEQYAPHLEAVLTILEKYQIRHGDRCANRVWKAITISEHKPELEEHLNHLERSKSTITAFLSSINLQLTSEIHDDINYHFGIVEPSLQRIETNFSVMSNTSENIYSRTFQLEEAMKQSSTDIMRHMDMAVQKICGNIPTLIEEGLQKSLEGVTDPLIARRTPSARQKGLPFSNTTANIYQRPSDTVEIVSKIENRQRMQRPISRRTFCKSFPLPIGFIQTQVVQARSKEDYRTDSQPPGEMLHFDIVFVPFKFLSSYGRHVSFDKIFDRMGVTSWNFSLRTYNTIPNDAPIILACRKNDVDFMQKLFEYRQASPFDVDQNGASLLSHVLPYDCEFLGSDNAHQAIRLLIQVGADPGLYVKDFLRVYKHFAGGFEFQENADWSVSHFREPTRILHEILQDCLQNCQVDPFLDTDTLLTLWILSIGGSTVPPLDPSYLFWDNLAGLEDLVYEHPDRIFHDLLLKHTAGSVESSQKLLDQSYETLAYMCHGGETSFKTKLFSKAFAKRARRLAEADSCYCDSNSSHLLFKAVQASFKGGDRTPRTIALERHVYRLLVVLLESGEDPEACCSCKTSWQSVEGYRTVTDVAISSGLLDVWRRALDDCGFDSTRIIDRSLLEGFTNLFEEPKPSIRWSMAPIKTIGTGILITVSSIV